ncbi:hypothetical protein LGN17_20920 [Burkholderia sp. AU30280]|uniref:hypothetical protein n=1 Tax=Burkholderia sp. AU30280 TaxID=2879628 RepID=UPI001CF58BA6|nr:hypothetical protein [Burkholderia sp. AU30280]MCA8274949.1 hypothetical protein [Burkholderia sp. AU30280]
MAIIGTVPSATRGNRTATVPGIARRIPRRPAGQQVGPCTCPRRLPHETVECGERSHTFIFEASESAALTFIKRAHGSDWPSKKQRRRPDCPAAPSTTTRSVPGSR